ncbi:T9SS type A sorting domain-containing protein [Aquimarina sp. AU58]|uniref:T9SS type A sorting domain-containing protein n=1 Tax=Aquimarina sp. AU58 TaxID=1874112 RepID=UPI000D645B54|nr:T9SS type A sorting domain-containing protein [Aquimarina sp. AU58]
MKTKYFFILLVVCIPYFINAQETLVPQNRTVDVSISVTDSFNDKGIIEQVVKLKGPERLAFKPHDIIRLKLNLDYSSSISTTKYLRLSYTVIPSDPFGASAPVIIPPVKNDPIPAPSIVEPVFDYPYVFNTPLFFKEKNNSISLRLMEYDNEEDYRNDEDGSDGVWLGDILEIDIFIGKHRSGRTSMTSTHKNPIQFYPNPVKEHLTIEYFDKQSNDHKIQIDVYNNNGIKLRSRTLKSKNSIGSKAMYRFETLDLEKGMYYCQVTCGENRYYKTLIKN